MHMFGAFCCGLLSFNTTAYHAIAKPRSHTSIWSAVRISMHIWSKWKVQRARKKKLEKSTQLSLISICGRPREFTTLRVSQKNKKNRVEPPVSDQPKCKDWAVAYGRWSLTRIESQRVSSEKRCRYIYFMEDIYCMQCLSYDMCSSMFSLTFFVYS